MKWEQIYDLAIEYGIDNDIRYASTGINKIKYENQYPDSLILSGNGEKEIKNLFVAVDIGTSELLLVRIVSIE